MDAGFSGNTRQALSNDPLAALRQPTPRKPFWQRGVSFQLSRQPFNAASA